MNFSPAPGELLSVGHSFAAPNDLDDEIDMPDSTSQTVKPPPPPLSHHSLIESTLELTALTDIGPTVFTNTRPLWRPPNARGIFGGAVIAQSLAAAIRTVPENFSIHSMHCYFVLAGDWTIPVIYTVEIVRDGRSFATRTVQARQKGKCIFTTTCSFQRPSEGKDSLLAQEPFPEGVKGPDECEGGEETARRLVKEGRLSEEGFKQWKKTRDTDPFERRIAGIYNHNDPNPTTKRVRSWVRAKGTISAPAGAGAHVEALAYVSDSWFLGTLIRTHKSVNVGMMVSLDHTIYFHAPFRADEWMFMESDSPWAGDQRGLVHQRILDRQGNLLVTCFQEGLIRVRDLKGEDEVAESSEPPTKKESKL
ncbi:hypothetical protein AOL_s00097g317 [Orbilia oligospora ATCC 24927]|uniref:Acyl-CoA thioesterase 8 n=2 Tax=Orbilia oligospora TaxID=2813651 RepID=G1XIZ0_ARTOA|nr:hypothetical protein AOL_s00097g317 [Orbilia oligospora ATCC 24927]EGX46891.1 hypothetical protein AOL_s00097g317 [Orbilia oligospora ATCC 24927]KAF3283700.1 hypothetical protein TWF970_000876 [Orbilia oligospora]